MLVRFFPIQRVSQIVATIAIIVLTVAVIAFRMSRPERLFASINTDDVTRVLRSVELPSLDRYPGTALADSMVAIADGRPASVLPPKIAVTALALFGAVRRHRAAHLLPGLRARTREHGAVAHSARRA